MPEFRKLAEDIHAFLQPPLVHHPPTLLDQQARHVPAHKTSRCGDKCGFLDHRLSPTLSFPLPNGRFRYIKIARARPLPENQPVESDMT